MRCVDRGAPPISADGSPVVFGRYQDAGPYLKQRLGRYCSFCERWIPSSLAVEHKQPKSIAFDLSLEWSNFLLACANCNSVKGKRQVSDVDIMWPDLDNTFGALDYLESGRIVPASSLSQSRANRAARLLAIVGLDRGPGQVASDHRWFDRLEVWRLAQQSAADLEANPSPRMAEAIIEMALAKGGFSIWMRVFVAHDHIKEALVARFPGTVVHPIDDGGLA